MTCTFISAGMITFMTFIQWRKGPSWWQKVAPFVFVIFSITDYLIFPILCLAMCITSFFHLNGHALEWVQSYYLYFAIIFASRLIDFPIKIYPLLKEAKKIISVKFEL